METQVKYSLFVKLQIIFTIKQQLELLLAHVSRLTSVDDVPQLPTLETGNENEDENFQFHIKVDKCYLKFLYDTVHYTKELRNYVLYMVNNMRNEERDREDESTISTHHDHEKEEKKEKDQPTKTKQSNYSTKKQRQAQIGQQVEELPQDERRKRFVTEFMDKYNEKVLRPGAENFIRTYMMLREQTGNPWVDFGECKSEVCQYPSCLGPTYNLKCLSLSNCLRTTSTFYKIIFVSQRTGVKTTTIKMMDDVFEQLSK